MQILPKNENFYEPLEQLSGHIVTVMEHLSGIIQSYPNIDAPATEIEKEDEAADELTHSELEKLDKAFITPLDREDILHLMTDMYCVVETVADMAQRLNRYKLKDLDPEFGSQVESLKQITNCLNEMVLQLRKGHQLSELNSKMQEMHCLSREADQNLDAFLGKLFEGNPDPLEVIKRKDIHDLMKQAIESCENVSRTLQQVVLKNS